MTCTSCGAVVDGSARFCPSCGAARQAVEGGREARKKVAVLFMDLVGSTELAERLDPEPLRQIMDRYFAMAAACVAEHGGVVEKFIGDAVVAVFGAVVAREDDAVRAVRAAAGALDGLRELSADLERSHHVGLAARCGICSGDVMVVSAGHGDVRVVGDAVNTAARLQTAAGSGEILIGADAAALVRSQVGIEPVPALRLKGKAREVAAWRVVDARAARDEETVAWSAPLTGRADELEDLAQAFRRVARRRQVGLVTVVGAPGIGKSRLVQEFLGTLEGAPEEVLVLSGRCSAYGRGITYRPLAELLESGPGGWRGLVRQLPSSSDGGTDRRAVEILEAVTRHHPDQSGVEEIAWALRHLLEALGRSRPVVLVLEDLHWAEATLLDLVDDVAAWLTDVPVLLLCAARTELLESRPSWGGGKTSATTLELGPLSREQSRELIRELVLAREVHAQEYRDDLDQVAAQCDGNPLFIELMLDVFADTAEPGDPDGAPRIPPTIHALLGARLDQLSVEERRVLEMAAVLGREFAREPLRAMAGGEGVGGAELDDLLARLVRRRVIRRDGRSESGYRFAQGLLRDTAYSFTQKVLRERWHLFLGDWFAARWALASGSGGNSGGDSGGVMGGAPAESPGTPPVDDDAMAFARHVEAAGGLRRELRPGDPGLPEAASAAADVLIGEGMAALRRKDLPAAAGLLERGRDLLPVGDVRHLALALHICDSWLGLWDEPRARAALTAVAAALPGDRQAAVTCAVQRCVIELRLGVKPPEAVSQDACRIAADLLPGRSVEDDLAWCRFHQLQGYLHLVAERAALAEGSFLLALARARALGDRYEEDRLLCALCEIAQWAPSKVSAGLALCAELAERFAGDRALLVPVLVTRACLKALGGDVEGARGDLETAGGYSGELHLDLADAAVIAMSGFVEALAGEHQSAEVHYRRGAAVLRQARQIPDAQVLDAEVARALVEQGRAREAAGVLDRLDGEGAGENPRVRLEGAVLRGRIASRAGDHAAAVEWALRAWELCDGTDDLCLTGRVLADVAVVFCDAGRVAEAREAAVEAVRRFETKGATPAAERVREWLSSVGGVGMKTGPGLGTDASGGVGGNG